MPLGAVWFRPHTCSLDSILAIDIFVAESPPIAQKVAVYLAVKPIRNPTQRTVPFTGRSIAAQAAMWADRLG